MLDSEFLQNFKYVNSFVLRFVELPNLGSKKKWHALLLYIAMKTPKIDILKNTCSYSECSSLIYCGLFHKKLGFIIVFF